MTRPKMTMRERAEMDRAIRSLKHLYESGRTPDAGHPCVDMGVQYLRLRGLSVPSDLRHMYRNKRGDAELNTFFGIRGVIDAVLNIADELGLKRLADPLDARRGDLLFLSRRESFIGISEVGVREVLVFDGSKLVRIESPRIHIAWDVSPPPADDEEKRCAA